MMLLNLRKKPITDRLFGLKKWLTTKYLQST